ncbi:MAG: hypothetical protein ABR520_04725 [Mycobacteriales bacterium]|nr:hypothetical protein [Frankia sp.]
MLIDCETCTVRGEACSDCVVTVMLDLPGVREVDPDEARALDVLARSGLVPVLRLSPPDAAAG